MGIGFMKPALADEPIREGEKEEKTLSSEGEDLLDKVVVKGEDARQFPREMILDLQEEYTDEQRQSIYQKILKMNVPQKIRLAMMGNRETRNILIRDRHLAIPMTVLRSPRLSEDDILTYAQQRSLAAEVLKAIAGHKIWMKNYLIKLAVVSNPKTPLPAAIKFLDHLHDKDLQVLSRSKSISSVLCRAAYRVHSKRTDSR